MEQTVLPGFKRRQQIGFNIISFKEELQTLFLKITNIGVFTKKDGDQIDYADVVDLTTGEEGRMWLDGALKYNFGLIAQNQQFPFSVEAQYLGKKPATIVVNGKDTDTLVNSYRVWLIEEEDAKRN